ncbi:hypothetical protein LQ327_25390 [Actinomycetospora endophytica]|uniref:DUF6777 domain-containing protein n=1 Tax=Actinomycetospora endophytica TaxID=2291215 RepID=A0ABS8PEK8_9PSEU|nr:DUF6777 domain-containing protein [Actinomycetospora endophytica]MCD2196710.1 hypothetical protein [Actinomycetospora endophytica]
MTNFDPRTVHPQQYGTPRHDAPQFRTGQFGPQTSSGRQFAGSVPPPLGQSTPKRPLAGKIVAGMVAAGLVLGGAGTWIALSSSPAQAAVQSTSFAGANPTTSPFGTDAPQVAAVAATGPQSGDTKGLYAATTPPACTTADLLGQLQADPAKLAAFGGVFGLGASDVPAFVDSLSPVVLRANTSVTDHPYSDGAFTEQPAILAAGTAVLVNSYGEPTVKCFNGNPLTAGAQASDAVTITPTPQVITQFSFTSIDNSRVVVIPGKPDPKPHPGPNPTTTPQPDPALVKQAQEAKATADKARAEATAARERADGFKNAATIAQTNLNGAEADLARAIAEGANPTVIAELTKVRDQAKQDLETKNNQFKFADAAATSAKGTAEAAEKNAKDAQQKADDSAKAPAAKDEQDKATKVQNNPTVGPGAGIPAEEQTLPAQGPATGTTTCTATVVADTATKDCKLPTGSADAATGTTPATGTTKGGETGSTGETGSSATGGSAKTGSSSSSSSNSSTGGSQKSSKEGSDQ